LIPRIGLCVIVKKAYLQKESAMNPRLKIFIFALLLILVASWTRAASADELTLNYQGVTDGNSSLGSSVMPSGLDFDIQATFNSLSPSVIVGTGIVIYAADSLQAEVNGDLYTAASTSGIYIELVDATNSALPGANHPILYNQKNSSGVAPGYTEPTSGGWSATNPTPVVFSGYSGSLYSSVNFHTTSSGATLTLGYDPTVGVDASITGSAVPEGSTFAYFLMGLAAMGAGRWMGRRGMGVA
jgi:hypothetical protein